MTSTIAAIATPAGRGAIAVIRLSGPDALAVCQRHIQPTLQPRHASFASFVVDGQMLDEVVAVYFQAPHSYTGDDTVEISCHGSYYIQQAILQALLDSGARLAEPGEFTRRAFLNGKMDLSQAEAVADLIDSTNATQHRLAISQLRGGYAQKLKEFRQQLVELTALLELELDFSQEDVEFADRTQLRNLLSAFNTHLSTLIDSFHLGNALKQGIPVAIVGEPNVGKSSLLNALLHDNRAIVSPIPGTTRDTIEDSFTVGGITFRIIDTAGLRQSDDTVEQLGIERTRKIMKEAEMVLCVGTTEGSSDKVIPEELQNRKHFLILNKADLMDSPRYGQIGENTYSVSALTGDGIEELVQGMVHCVNVEHNNYDTLITNVRHLEALKHVQAALANVEEGLHANLPADLVAIDLRDALYHLGTITGEVAPDEILGTIFSRFCVGK